MRTLTLGAAFLAALISFGCSKTTPPRPAVAQSTPSPPPPPPPPPPPRVAVAPAVPATVVAASVPAPPVEATLADASIPTTEAPTEEPKPEEPTPQETRPVSSEELSALQEVVREDYKTSQGQSVKLTTEHDPWADKVVSYRPGNPPPRTSKNPQAALGKPDYVGRDDAEGLKTNVALGRGGTVTLRFTDNVLIDGPGDDLVVFEIGGMVEPTAIAVSEDGKTWIDVGVTQGGKSTIDLAPFKVAGKRLRLVRVTDAKAGKSDKGTHAGADIDAVGALNSLPVESTGVAQKTRP